MLNSTADTLHIFVDEAGDPTRYERFLKVIWPQAGEIHDLHFGPVRGTFFNARQPLNLAGRFGEQKREKP